jgi:Cu-Zn family superoxide dismutase
MRWPILLLAPAVSLASYGMAQTGGGQPYRLFFDWGKPELTRDAEATLAEVVAAYRSVGPSRIEIAGHTDRSGSDAVNLAASRRRAEAVKAYLVAEGIPAAVLRVSAYGERNPIVPTEDGVREAQNRRVEIRFAGAAAPSAVGANSAVLIRADGSRAGAVSLTEGADGALLFIDATGLPPGVHGIHLHAVGRCETPDFTSAGPHWNPGQRQHGLDNAQGPHGGDLPNVTVGGDGALKTMIKAASGSLDADGAALVIHAAPDDNRTDPSGNSGARIACAAFNP